MDLHANNSYNVDYHVDADFAGLWEVENYQDHMCIKSRTGFLSIFNEMYSPIEIYITNPTYIKYMKYECITLSQFIRELITVREF